MHRPSLPPSAAALLLLFALLLLAFVLYLPGLNGDFMFDDRGSILDNDWVQIERLTPATLEAAAYSFHGSPLGRPVAMISFALDHLFAGLDPARFKLTNLLIHLLNGCLVYLFSGLALEALHRSYDPSLAPSRIRGVALLVTALWLFHPLAITSVLYVVQRMTSLAALFSLVALILYLWGRLRLMDGRRGGWVAIAALVCVAMPLAVLSKESALLIPLFLFLMEWLLLGHHCSSVRRERALKGAFALLIGVPAIVALIYLAFHSGWITDGYAGRAFTLEERVMTEGRVLWFYVRLILLPSFSAMGIFHDDIPVSSDLLTPLSTLPSLLGLLLLAAAAVILRRRVPPLSFGILFFFAGHLMESTIFPLEIAHEHRNYLPMLGILFALGYYLLHPRLPALLARRGAAAMLVALFIGVTWARVGQWSEPLGHWLSEATFHPRSPAALFEAGRAYFVLLQRAEDEAARREFALRANRHFSRSYSLDAHYPAGLFGNLLLADEMGWPPDEREVGVLEEHLRTLPSTAISVVLLHQVSQCRVSGECATALPLLRRLYRAALDNPTLPRKSRSMLLSEAAIHALMMRDRPSALRFARQALAGDPSTPQHWLNYANLLIQSGRLEDARRVLADFKQTRMAGWVPHRLETQEALLRAARAPRMEATPTERAMDPSQSPER